MKDQPSGKPQYRVERSCSGLWEVSVHDLVKTIASFSNKKEAVEYACFLAERSGSAEVTVWARGQAS